MVVCHVDIYVKVQTTQAHAVVVFMSGLCHCGLGLYEQTSA